MRKYTRKPITDFVSLPRGIVRMPGYSYFLLNFKKTIQEFLDLSGSNKKYILERRYGLDGKPKDVLEDIGIELNLTRERIRQVEARLLSDLKLLMKGQILRKPATKFCMDILIDSNRFHASFSSRIILSEEEALKLIPHDLTDRPYLLLFFELVGIERVEALKEDFYVDPGMVDPLLVPQYLNSIKSFLEQEPCFHYMKDICEATQIPHYLIKDMLEALSFVEKKKNDNGRSLYAMKVPYLNTYRDKVYRILLDAGEPLHSSIIIKRIEERGCSTHSFTQVSLDERFVPLGATGYWGLSKWGIFTETIEEAAVRVLSEAKKSLSLKEIHEKLQKDRPDINPLSLNSIIKLKERTFVSLTNGKIILRKWSDRYKKIKSKSDKRPQCSQKTFDDFLVNYIGLNKERTTQDIIKKAEDVFGLSANGVTVKLIHSKIVLRRKTPRRVYYRIALNYREIMKKQPEALKRDTIQKLAAKYLKRRTKAVPLKTLVHWLQEKGDFERQTIYGALREKNQFEKTQNTEGKRYITLCQLDEKHRDS